MVAVEVLFCGSSCRGGLSECQSRSSKWYLHQWVWPSHARRVLEEVHVYVCKCLLYVVQNTYSLPSLSLSLSLSLTHSYTRKLSRKQTSRTPSLFLLPHSWSVRPVAEWRVPLPPVPVLWQHSATADAAHQTVLSTRQLGWECGGA